MNQEEKRSDEILDEVIEGIRNETIDPEVVESAAKRVWTRISEEVEPEAVGAIRSCADFQALIPAYRAGELSEARALLVTDHTHECIACRKVLMGQRAGMSTVLVLTGVTRPADLAHASIEPDHVLDSIAQLPQLLENN